MHPGGKTVVTHGKGAIYGQTVKHAKLVWLDEMHDRMNDWFNKMAKEISDEIENREFDCRVMQDDSNERRCDGKCIPQTMMGRSWWKSLGYNIPCECAIAARRKAAAKVVHREVPNVADTESDSDNDSTSVEFVPQVKEMDEEEKRRRSEAAKKGAITRKLNQQKKRAVEKAAAMKRPRSPVEEGLEELHKLSPAKLIRLHSDGHEHGADRCNVNNTERMMLKAVEDEIEESVNTELARRGLLGGTAANTLNTTTLVTAAFAAAEDKYERENGIGMHRILESVSDSEEASVSDLSSEASAFDFEDIPLEEIAPEPTPITPVIVDPLETDWWMCIGSCGNNKKHTCVGRLCKAQWQK
jgi:hypothetical protein